jgi:hypothetical protein
MRSLSRLSNIKFHLIILAAIIFLGCDKDSEKKDYVARVNDSYLTEIELNKFDSLVSGSYSRTEIIKRWIDKELLYQEALKAGATDDEEFNRIINDAKRELASSMLLNKYLEANLHKPNENELREFYSQHINEFKAEENIYVFNSASFKNENAAIRFRTKLIEINWDEATDDYSEDKSLIKVESGNALLANEIYPIQLLNLIEVLIPGEVSIVLEENSEKFTVVNLVQNFQKGSIPPIEFIRNDVEARLISEKRELISRDFLEDLHSKNEIEIKAK